MTLFVDPIEALWVGVTGVALILTLFALVDSRRILNLARNDHTLSHEARELVAGGNVRREALRVIVQALLLSVAIPSLFVDETIRLSPALVALILVPVVLLISSIFDALDRGRLAQILVELVRTERDTLALEASVQENIALTKHAGDRADAAYAEANTVNEKIATLTQLVAGKENKAT